MTPHLTTRAESELHETIVYYNSCRDGLGKEFFEEYKQAVEQVLEYPSAWTELSKNTRRRLIGKFPYQLVYRVHKEVLMILAIRHTHRKPRKW